MLYFLGTSGRVNDVLSLVKIVFVSKFGKLGLEKKFVRFARVIIKTCVHVLKFYGAILKALFRILITCRNILRLFARVRIWSFLREKRNVEGRRILLKDLRILG